MVSPQNTPDYQNAPNIDPGNSSLPGRKGSGRGQPQGAQTSVVVPQEYINSVTKFGFNLYDKVVEAAKPHENIFASPVSVAMCLAMIANGTKGTTHSEMIKALKANGMSAKELNDGVAAFKQLLENLDPKIKIQIANSVWPDKKIDLVAGFDQRMRKAFDAEVRSVDYYSGNTAAVAMINGWVNSKTNGMIPKLFDTLDPATVAVLVNAIYFHGSWQSEFDKANTKDDKFTTSNGKKVKVPLMEQSGKFQYHDFAAEGFQAIKLPYGKSGEASMVVLLPHQDSNLEELNNKLDSKNWSQWLATLNGERRQKGTILLPRFEATYQATLNDALKGLGINLAFTDGADFSAMIERGSRLKLSAVIHKAIVKVNEEGTEAAAVTGGMVTVTSVRPIEIPFVMKVDRPFFFAIESKGAPVFYGAIKDPR